MIKTCKENDLHVDEKVNEINARLQAWALNEFFNEDDNDVDIPEFDLNDSSTISNSIETVTLERCAMKYVARYLIYKCLNKFGCVKCKHTLTRGNQNFEHSTIY